MFKFISESRKLTPPYQLRVKYPFIIYDSKNCSFFFSEKWDKKNLKFHPNGTVSFNQEKIFEFQESLSNGSEDDLVVVPNIPMLVSIHIGCYE